MVLYSLSRFNQFRASACACLVLIVVVCFGAFEARAADVAPTSGNSDNSDNVTTSQSKDTSKDMGRPLTTRVYPLWEGTARVLAKRSFIVGLNSAAVGVGGRTQIGLSPMTFILRTPNIEAKTKVYENEKYHVDVAVSAGFFALLKGASSALFSPQYATRLSNRGATLFVMPLSLIVSYQPCSFLTLHNTFTVTGVFPTAQLVSSAYGGDFLTAEFTGFRYHSVLLHTGEIGMWSHDLFVLGASYRYQRAFFELKVGYFYRLNKDGGQGAPIVDLGVVF